MAKVPLIVLIISLFLLVTANIFVKPNKVVKVDVMEGRCPEHGTLVVEVHNISLVTSSTRQTTINTDFIVNEDLGSKVETYVSLTRCKSKENPDSCQNFTTIKFPVACSVFTAKGQFWTPVFSNIHPPAKCPFNKGTYKLRGGYLDADKLPFAIETDSYWKVKFECVQPVTKRPLLCILYNGQLVTKKE